MCSTLRGTDALRWCLAGPLLPVELAALPPGDEGLPCAGGEDQHRPGWILGVPDSHGAWQVTGDLDTIPGAAAITALAPRGPSDFGNFHFLSPIVTESVILALL